MSYPPGSSQGNPVPPPVPSSMPMPPANYGGPYGYAVSPLDTLLAPARRVGILMFVMASFALIFGGLFFILAVAIGSPEVNSSPEFQEVIQEFTRESGQTNMDPIKILQIVFAVFGALFLVYAIVSAVLGFFVRRGGKGAVITALVLTSLVLLFSGLYLVAMLVAAQFAGVCLVGIAVLLLVLQLVWLIQATGKSTQVEQWRAYLAGQGLTAQWPQQGAYPPGPGYAYPGANPYSLPPAPPAQNFQQPPPPPQP